ncbi:exodeoxyribonuclease III [Kaustia mangrovi]|uniref:Exodeoxyribonuclease III n=1 Tax=Kaustia mangrovi TaxID=2593653 RepID=A0A7S8C4U0_9HYPH|nr:exodeoxyribonuclease III [Kaustia mangrovi]QPC43342.1 exodeoxyribonuclease III [Kaustia mangrovi]
MRITLATWNINSVRLRQDLVARFLEEAAPDVLCLQETKCPDDQFPSARFRDLGYEHIAPRGQAGYHGVATLSRIPFREVSHRQFCGKQDARHVAITLETGAQPLVVHNFYVPAGGDEPDPDVNEKFAHKLAFLKEMRDWFGDGAAHDGHPMVLVGDLNIAPLETDVWSHKQLLKVVSHTPVEVEHLDEVRASHDWVDVVREHIPPEEKLFTWWSYRSRDWQASNRGRRLDHIWTSPGLGSACTGIDVLSGARSWPRPSDHVPVTAVFDLDRL